MPTYEAIYEDGELEWIDEEPDPGRHRVEVTVLDSEPNKHNREEVRRMLERTRGAWGTGKSLEEVEEEAKKLRDEWDRLDRDSLSKGVTSVDTSLRQQHRHRSSEPGPPGAGTARFRNAPIPR